MEFQTDWILGYLNLAPIKFQINWLSTQLNLKSFTCQFIWISSLKSIDVPINWIWCQSALRSTESQTQINLKSNDFQIIWLSKVKPKPTEPKSECLSKHLAFKKKLNLRPNDFQISSISKQISLIWNKTEIKWLSIGMTFHIGWISNSSKCPANCISFLEGTASDTTGIWTHRTNWFSKQLNLKSIEFQINWLLHEWVF